MRVRVIRETDHSAAEWPGGTAAEMAVWPENACFKERSFQWLISIAGIEEPEADLTHLPGFRRTLLLLSGELHLMHGDGREVRLKAFEQYTFDGGIVTRCAGQCTYLSIITATGIKADVRAVHDVRKTFDPLSHEFDAFYCLSGNVIADVKPSHEEIDLMPGDLFLTEEAGHGLHLRLTGADGGAFSGVRVSINSEARQMNS